MSAQKRDLSRRLKAAESRNRQLRSELQEVRAGKHSGPATRPLSTQLPSTMSAPCAGVRGKGCCFYSHCENREQMFSLKGKDPSSCHVQSLTHSKINPKPDALSLP